MQNLNCLKKHMKVKGGVFEKGTSGRGEGKQEKIIGGEYDQSTLYTCMKI
jgi:hypothetical protein